MNNKRFFTCLLSVLLVLGTLPVQFDHNRIHAETIQENDQVVFATYGNWPALSPDGKTVFVGKGRPDNKIENVYDIGLYDTQTGSLLKTITVDNSTDYPNYSPLGSYIALNGDYFLLLDGKTGEKIKSLPYYYTQFSFKETDDTLIAFAYSTNDELLRGNRLSIFDTKSKSVIYEKDYPTDNSMKVAMHPTLPIVAVSYGLDVEIINYETKELISKIENPFNYPESRQYWAIYQLSYSNDGKLNMVNAYGAEKPFLQYISDQSQNYTLSTLSINAYTNEPEKNPYKISYGKNNEIILHYSDKIKFFNSYTGSYLRTLSGDYNDVVFSKDMSKIAYTKNVGYNSGHMPEYVEVQDYPILSKKVNTIEFKDPAIYLREGSSTYYSLEYINDFGEKSLLDPEEFQLESLDENVLTIDSTNKIVANKAGNTLVKATYYGQTDYLSVEVQEKSTSLISVETLYDSSRTIKGTAPAGATVFGFVGKEYQTVVNDDGTFSFEIDDPLKANTFIHFMLKDGADYLFESVIRDTVAPKPPTITEIDEITSEVEGITEANALITIIADQNSVSNSNLSVKSTLSILPRSSNSTSGKTTFTTKAGKDGKFKLSLKGMSGLGFFKATSTDLVGNKSKPTRSKLLDTKAPTAPRVFTFCDISTSVNGVAEPNAKIHVRKNGKLISNSTASKNGAYSVKVPKQVAGTLLSVTATDASNNISKATTVKTLKAPKSPTVNKVTYKSKTVTGKAQPYTTITVKYGSKVLGTSKVNSKGLYTVKITPQKKGSKLSVYCKNGLGATSLPGITTVK